MNKGLGLLQNKAPSEMTGALLFFGEKMVRLRSKK